MSATSGFRWWLTSAAVPSTLEMGDAGAWMKVLDWNTQYLEWGARSLLPRREGAQTPLVVVHTKRFWKWFSQTLHGVCTKDTVLV